MTRLHEREPRHVLLKEALRRQLVRDRKAQRKANRIPGRATVVNPKRDEKSAKSGRLRAELR